MASKLRKAIGAVKDQTSISLTKVSSNNTSNLRVVILKATSHDDVPIDERHVHEIVHFVSSSKLYASYCARALGKRIGRTRNWIVALKSLLLILRIFQDGDPYFPREVLHAMKRGAKILNLSGFRDDSNSTPWEFTVFVRAFAGYLDERLDCFLTGKLQRRYTTYRDHTIKASSVDHHQNNRSPYEPVRNIKPPMMLDKISYWQRLLDRAISTKPTGEARSNRLVQICFYAIVHETFDLYKDISDALTLLLDSFFHLQYQICVSAYHTCVKASKQYEDLSHFYGSCKEMGVGRTSEYPCVQCISEELMETLQEFLKDQSSFPTIAKSPNNRPLLLLSDSSSPSFSRPSSRRDSYGAHSEYSDTTRYYECNSEFGARGTSLEELISATENGIAPSNSIDLEEYSDQFEKKSQRDSTFRISESGSTRSLPLINSMVDLLSLDGWPNEDEKEIQQENKIEPSLKVITPSAGTPSSAKSTHNNSFDVFFDIATSSPVQPRESTRKSTLSVIPKGHISSGKASNTNNFIDITEATTTATMQSSKVTETNNLSVSHPSYFDAFSDATTPSIQDSNAENFNAFPEATTSSAQPSNTPWMTEGTQSHPFQFTDSSEATTSSAQPSNTPWTLVETQSHPFLFKGSSEASTSSAQPSNTPWTTEETPSHPFSFRDSSETTTSAQPSNTPWMTNVFGAFPEVPTHSIQHIPFNSYQGFPTPPTQYMTSTPNLHTFYQTRNQQVQDFGNMENRYNGFHGHDQATNSMEFNNFSNQDHVEQNNEHDDVQTTGWELAIVETSKPGQSANNMNTNFNPYTFDNFYNQPTSNHVYNHSSSTPKHYNPFLQDPTEHNVFEQFAPTFQATPAPTFSTQHHTFEATQSPTFSTQHHIFQATQSPTFSTQHHTFQATQPPTFSTQHHSFQATQSPTFSTQHHTFQATQSPTFSTQHHTFPAISMPTFSTQQQQQQQQQQSMTCNDPFAVGYPTPFSERMSYESMSQRNLLQQQQLWLQNQNKIMEKHMA